MSEFADVVIPPEGIVTLAEKQVPVCTKDPPYDDCYCKTRAVVDVSKFKAKLLSMPDSAWHDENQEGNVKITRPAHDAWGIKKIVFTFCDDFLLKVLDFPWSQSPEWKEHLDPIYKAIGIDESKIVRSLLASMPPGINIPIHHDTGYWVKHTHRIHVAIITGKAVDFQVGPTPELMKKISFDEGRIVELNNQAKHQVCNSMPDTHRVHLIFDYVDEHPIKQRFLLNPGEEVFQTRRSIDLAREAKVPANRVKAPSFIVIGAQKCGTTSMYEYLCQHPLVVRGKRRETHYFDWRWNNELGAADWEAHYNFYLNFFYAEALEKHISLRTGESTPSYLLHSDLVIPRMKEVCPWAKLIVMLRNPTDRAFSQFQMAIDPSGNTAQLQVRGESSYKGKSFETIIRDEIAALRKAGITPTTDVKTFQDKVLTGLPMGHGGHSIVARGLYVLQLRAWMEAWPADQIKVYSMDQLKGGKSAVQNTFNDVCEFLDFPPHDIEDVEAKNTRSYDPIPDNCKQMLKEFYKPFNDELDKYLNREFGW